jgi:hypothetical protein
MNPAQWPSLSPSSGSAGRAFRPLSVEPRSVVHGDPRLGWRALAASATVIVFAGVLADCDPPDRPATTAAPFGAAACADIPEGERQRPTYYNATAIDAVVPFMGVHQFIKFTEPELRGADIVVHATAGLTKQWIARVLGCHLGYCSQAGADPGACAEDPLRVGSPTVSFDDTTTAFVIRIAGRNSDEGEEILRRARLLVDARPTPQ